jgi:hypothetical protein
MLKKQTPAPPKAVLAHGFTSSCQLLSWDL